ncbi:MAG: DUF3971 domain-containing protein, partial [Rhodospirillaceae bacterium]|nr:DUF3971 domain-containing protein [Rhodospirillaceae bacterium]
SAALIDQKDTSADFLAQMLAELTAPESADRPLGLLASVRLSGADIVLDDHRLGVVWRMPRADVVASRDASGILVLASLRTEIGEQSTRFEIEGIVAADGSSELLVEFSDLDIDNLARVVPELERFGGLRAKLKGAGSVKLGSGGRVEAAALEFTGGPGAIVHPRLDVPVPIRSLRAKARFSGQGARLELDAAEADLGGPVLTASGTIDDLAGVAPMAFRLGLRDLTTPDLYRYWPSWLAANARGWIVANIADGAVEAVDLQLKGRLGPNAPIVDALTGTMRAAGLTVSYLRPMPPIRRAAATASFDLDSFDVAVSSGTLRDLVITSGTVKLGDLRTDNESAAIDATVRGKLRDAMEVIDSRPLGYAGKLGLKPSEIEGEAAIRVVLRMPLVNDLELNQIEIAASAALSNVAARRVVMGMDAENATLVLKVDKRGLDLSGAGRIAGIHASVKWVEDFNDGAEVPTRLEAKARIGAEDQGRLGIDFAPYLTGPVDVDLTALVKERGKTEISANLGLDDAILAIPLIEWRKPAGTPGTAGLALTLDKAKIGEIRSFAVKTADLHAGGRAAFAPDGGLARIQITQFAHGLTDVSGNVALRGDGGFDVDIVGVGLDAKPLLDAAKRPGGEKVPLKITAKIDRVYLDPARSLGGLTGSLVHDGAHWRTINIDAGTGPTGQIALRFGQVGAGLTLSLNASDAGAALRVFDITRNVEGGRLRVSGVIDEGLTNRPLTGQLEIENFRMKQVPLLARLLNAASLTGIVDLLTGEGIHFTRLDGNYRIVEPELEIGDVRLYGDALGVTANGSVNLDDETAKLEGTIVPAYALNSLPGNIPLFGRLLVGPRGSGVFSATYKVAGPLTDPSSLTVNPLATLAPGFLRGLFNLIPSGSATGASPSASPTNPREDSGG